MPGAQFALLNSWGVDGFVVAERTITTKKGTMHIGEVLQPNAEGKVQHGWVFGNPAEMMPAPKPAAAKAAAPAAGAAPAKAAPAPAKPAAAPAPAKPAAAPAAPAKK
jgi:hypothetical protein